MANVGLTFSVDGTEAVIRGLKGVTVRLNLYAGNSVQQACRRIVARAQRLVPVLTGELKNSIGYAMRGPTLGVVGFAAPGSKYWYFVELGTVSAPARPFMRPAAEPERATFKVDMNNVVKRAVAYEAAYSGGGT